MPPEIDHSQVLDGVADVLMRDSGGVPAQNHPCKYQRTESTISGIVPPGDQEAGECNGTRPACQCPHIADGTVTLVRPVLDLVK
jgi:hypothetical protein